MNCKLSPPPNLVGDPAIEGGPGRKTALRTLEVERARTPDTLKIPVTTTRSPGSTGTREATRRGKKPNP